MGPEQVARNLSDLAGDAARSARAGDKIVEAAHERLSEVVGKLNDLRPKVLVDESAGREYLELTAEKRELDMVIARANAAADE